jgi:hypothetical protein
LSCIGLFNCCDSLHGIALLKSIYRTSKAKSCSYPPQTRVPVQQNGGRQVPPRHATSIAHFLPVAMHALTAYSTSLADLGTRLNEEQRRVLMAESERDAALKVFLRNRLFF